MPNGPFVGTITRDQCGDSYFAADDSYAAECESARNFDPYRRPIVTPRGRRKVPWA